MTELRAIEDQLVSEVVANQERLGLQVVTDGEFRSTSFPRVAIPERCRLPQGATNVCFSSAGERQAVGDVATQGRLEAVARRQRVGR